MRIVHTADWHVGRVWKNLNRLAETEAVLDHLTRFVLRERVDLLLLAGDVFDQTAPAPEAERLVYRTLRRIGEAGTEVAVIAGNHDHPGRVDAWGVLAELVRVHAVGKPRPAAKGGVLHLPTRCGEEAVVAALPFAPVRTWVSALELAGDETAAKARYAEMFQRAASQLSGAFRPDRVNVLMAHTHLEGAAFGDSERRVHLGDEWAAAPQALPAAAHYVALGHIHKPQRIAAAPAPTWYAGSPLQLDFGEAGQRKVFLFVEATPGKPARIEEVPYEGGTPLQDLRKTLAEIEAEQAVLRTGGWLRLTVPLVEADPDLHRRVRALVPNAVVVHPELPTAAPMALDRPAAGAAPLTLYRAFHQRTHEAAPTPEVELVFNTLYQEADA